MRSGGHSDRQQLRRGDDIRTSRRIRWLSPESVANQRLPTLSDVEGMGSCLSRSVAASAGRNAGRGSCLARCPFPWSCRNRRGLRFVASRLRSDGHRPKHCSRCLQARPSPPRQHAGRPRPWGNRWRSGIARTHRPIDPRHQYSNEQRCGSARRQCRRRNHF